MKKNKSLFISLGIIVVSLIVSIFAFIPVSNIHPKDGKNWMSKVNGDTLINQLSMPGTHDSGATHSIFDVSGKCQDDSISSQLNMGVRFLDLRLQARNNTFHIVHDFVDQGLTFDSVLKDCVNFVKNNDSEFLLLSIKEEYSPVNTDKWFDELLLEYINQYPDIIKKDKSLPQTLEECRGNIYILSRFNTTEFGIEAHYGWQDNTSFEMNGIFVQDHYDCGNKENKIASIESAFEVSKNTSDKLVLNFTSCYFDLPFPPTYAGSAANVINPWLDNFLANFTGDTGIVVMDFVSSNLTTSIYRRNY
jgi:1-phosphatidylinositol phosphodiesterase